MRERSFDPRHLDVEAFAERAGALDGSLPLHKLLRLNEATHPDAVPLAAVPIAWQASGQRKAVRGAGPQTWLHLHAETRVALTCQRCLQAVEVALAVDCSYRFVADEAAASEADIDAEEDLLPTTRSLDLNGLIEDELLMALPLVPRHEGGCPQPLVAPAPTDEPALETRKNPFEALAVLKVAKAKR